MNDFWRPLYSKDAVVDGHYSVTCYLEGLEGAYRAYVERSGGARGDGPFSDRFAAIAYHVPYGKMAIKAHRHLRALEGDADPAKSFERQVAPGLALPKLVGNIYTGSLYLALASALSESKDDLARALGRALQLRERLVRGALQRTSSSRGRRISRAGAGGARSSRGSG